MRIGPLSLTRRPAADTAGTPVGPHVDPYRPAPNDEVAVGEEWGATGTLWFSGILTGEEYNPDLVGEAAVRVYDRMRRSDGQIRSILMACKLPLLSARWTVKEASDDPRDVEIAQFVQDNLMGGLDRPWEEVLWHALTMLDFGFAVFENVYGIGDDGKVHLLKLAPRLAKTIYRWFPDDHDDLDRIQQRVYKLNPDGVSGRYQYPVIYRPNLTVLTFQKEGNNYQGISVLRAAYKHWYIKDQLYGIDAIALERNGMGVPFAIAPQGATKADRDEAGRALMSLHAHQRGYIQFPFGWAWGLEGTKGSVRDALPSINHHDVMIARSILASFLTLDVGQAQSHSNDLSTFFLMALTAVGKQIAHTVQQDAIRALVDLNWDVDRYPTLEVSNIDIRNLDEYLRGLSYMFTAGALTNNAETENALRRMIGLPDLPAEAAPEGGGTATVDTSSQGAAAAGKEVGAAGLPKPAAAALADPLTTDYRVLEPPFRRELTRLERHVDLRAIDHGLDDGKAALKAALLPVLREAVGAMVAKAGAMVKRGLPVVPERVTFPKRAVMVRVVLDHMRRELEHGREQVRAEAAKQGAKLADPVHARTPEQVDAFLRAKAQSLVGVLQNRVQAHFALGILDQTSSGELDVESLVASIQDAAERDVDRLTSTAVIDSVDLGRGDEAQTLGAETAQYSALLDAGTCAPCSEADGQEFDVGSDDYDYYFPPFQDCEGGDNCRCVYVYDFVAQANAGSSGEEE